MRILTLIAFGIWVGLAFLIYEIKYETRGLEARAAQLAKAIQEERENLAVARAEWSHVTRPDHVEKLARSVLKFEPMRADQIAEWKTEGGKPLPAMQTPPAASPFAPQDAIAALIGRTTKRSAAEPLPEPLNAAR